MTYTYVSGDTLLGLSELGWDGKLRVINSWTWKPSKSTGEWKVTDYLLFMEIKLISKQQNHPDLRDWEGRVLNNMKKNEVDWEKQTGWKIVEGEIEKFLWQENVAEK